MTPAAVTGTLLHDLVSGSHAEGITALGVETAIEHNDAVLLVAEPGADFDDTWQLPGGPVLPGQTLTDALHPAAAAIGLTIDEVTGYLGHHDHPAAQATTRVFRFAVTVTDPAAISRHAGSAARVSTGAGLACVPQPWLLAAGRGAPPNSHDHFEFREPARQPPLAGGPNNPGSPARQYGLSELAARLGWAAAGIEVIDTDLGLSGQLTEGRAGFKEVVGRVCLGEAGAIFGLEVSRLARSSADLAKLLELARLTDTLVIDADGVYDLSDINGRMLLGLKNQMAEVELHILGSRMDKAKRSAAARGELRLQLPAGFVRDDEGAIAIDPDQEVQAAIGDLFTAFTAAGSAYGVVGAFAGRRFPRRSQDGELTWAPLP